MDEPDQEYESGRRVGRRILPVLVSMTVVFLFVWDDPAKKKPVDPAAGSKTAAADARLLAYVRAFGGKVDFEVDDESRSGRIDLSGSWFADADVPALKEILAENPDIDALDLAGAKITDAGLGQLCKLSRLADLNVSGTSITDAGLVGVIGLDRLVKLDVSKTSISDLGLAHLRGSRSIEELNVASTQVSDQGIADLCRRLGPERLHVRRWAGSPAFFPFAAFREGGADSSAKRFSEELFAMNEQALGAAAREDPTAVVYRMLWMHGDRGPLSLRVVADAEGEGATLHVVALDRSAVQGGTPSVRKTVALSPAQWSELQRLIDDAQLLTSLTVLAEHHPKDGSTYLIEGVADGKYKLAQTISTNGQDARSRRIGKVFDEMVKLSGLPAADY